MEIALSEDQGTYVLRLLEHEYENNKDERLKKMIEDFRLKLRRKHPVFVLFPTEIKPIDFTVMYWLDDAELFKVCSLNKYTADLCRDPFRPKDEKDYPMPKGIG